MVTPLEYQGFSTPRSEEAVEGALGVAGLVLGGALVGKLESTAPASLPASFPQVLVSGFLVGLGTRVCISLVMLIDIISLLINAQLANGCTSGYGFIFPDIKLSMKFRCHRS